MSELLNIYVFILGIIVGSFLNVVIYRYNTGFTFRGRSKCLNCNRTLRWFELFPVFSFILQGGRCRNCRSKISWQYPLVELASGLLFWAIWNLHLTLALTVLYWVIFSLLLVILVYDLRHLIIPDGLVYGFIAVAFLAMIISGNWWGILAAIVLSGFFALLWLVSRGRWLGFGDAKLAFGVGLLLGVRGGISAIVMAFWAGALVGALLIIISRLFGRSQNVTMKSELPFAPFIILGVVLNLFLQLNVLNF